MKKALPFLLLFAAFISGCTLSKQTAGLQVQSDPNSKIFLDDKEQGQTPYKNEKLAPGEYTIKLQAEDKEWTNKIKLTEGTIFYVNRELATNPDEQSGESISLEKGKGITVVTTPSQVEIALDGQKQGNSPYLIPTVSAGTHELTLSKDGYVTRKIKIKAIDGYKIVAEVQLKSENPTEPSPSASPSATPAPTGPTPKPTATPRPTATPKATATPKGSITPTESTAPSGQTVTVLSTPTGWLRVRDKAGIDGKEISKVNTGDIVSYTEQLDTGWTAVTLDDGTKGYVVSKYVKVNK